MYLCVFNCMYGCLGVLDGGEVGETFLERRDGLAVGVEGSCAEGATSR